MGGSQNLLGGVINTNLALQGSNLAKNGEVSMGLRSIDVLFNVDS